MAIVDEAYYTAAYMGMDLCGQNFAQLEARAQDIIFALIGYSVTADTIDRLPVFEADQLRKAICAQIEHFGVNGLDSVAAGDGGAGRGFTVGKVSITSGGRAAGAEAAGDGALAGYIAPLAISYLEPTGLLYRGRAMYGGR